MAKSNRLVGKHFIIRAFVVTFIATFALSCGPSPHAPFTPNPSNDPSSSDPTSNSPPSHSASSENTLSSPLLGSAATFAVLAGSSVTNTGVSKIVGNLGVNPGQLVTGVTPENVTQGEIHAADSLAIQAQHDVTTAYNSVTGQTCTAHLSPQDLGGRALTQGVYCLPSSAHLAGTLILDAQGNPNAVFIFRIADDLTTEMNSSVRVISGGRNCRVFWQVGSSATFGKDSKFVGNILAQTNITLNTGANISGSVLVRNGEITMDSSTVSAESCSAPYPSPSPSVSPSPSPRVASSPSPAPSVSPSPSPRIPPAASSSPSPSPVVSPSPSRTASPSPLPLASPNPTPIPSPASSPIPSPAPSPVPSPTASPTASPSLSPTPSPSATVSPTPSATPDAPPSSSVSPTPSMGPAPSPSAVPSSFPSSSPIPNHQKVVRGGP